ncbi:helix-turn-helix transcriptional regulator [Paenibacillus qinlingensis]|uniref:Transcriptional regulator with XRE-family HTH domain n=1 Tax=Paenibacillus qinlingensis TaxID=1837343 RepID=A0ABU1P6U9_9BACL|nr:helix-turn-helix transcriptional regulator [Paenibacillus qinlingensis]MDR6555490.1 transcriptional regulator with XRE-family HTH domain [Paenibacillus qinlingensis]
MSELGNLLRRLRGDKSLREVAARAGLSHNYLSIVEKGIDPRSGSPVNPTPETLSALSKAYNYSYDELMILAGYIQPKFAEGSYERSTHISQAETFDVTTIFELVDTYTDEEIMDKFIHSSGDKKISPDKVRALLSYTRFLKNQN